MSLRGDCRKPGSAPPSCLPLLRWRAYYFYGCVWQLEQASGDLVVVCSGIYVFEWAGQTGMRRCCWRKAGKEPSTGLLLLLLLKNSDRKTENRPLSTAGTPGKQKIGFWLYDFGSVGCRGLLGARVCLGTVFSMRKPAVQPALDGSSHVFTSCLFRQLWILLPSTI